MNYYGTEYNLEKSPYVYEVHENDNIIKFHFSTENKLKKFKNRCEEFNNNFSAKESLKNGILINGNQLGYLLLYAKTENNGFRLTINNIPIRWCDLCVEYQMKIKEG